MVRFFQKCTFLLLWLTIFTTPWQKGVIIPVIGSMNKVLGVLLLFSAILTIIIQGNFKRLSLFFYLFGLFLFLNIASYFWAGNPSDALDKSSLLFQLAFLAWSFYEFANSKVRINSLMMAYVLGCVVIAIQTIYQYVTVGMDPLMSNRFFLEGYNPNYLGIIWSLGLPMAIYLVVNSYKVFFLYVPMAVFSILLTGSRTAIILLIFVALSSLWLLFKYKMRFRKIISLLLILTGIYVLNYIPAEQIQRISSTDGDLNGRTEIWDSGFEAFESSPLFGIGAGSYQEMSALYSVDGVEMSAHNSYISILVENGLTGFMLFFGMVIFLFATICKMDKGNIFRWLCLTLIVSWLVLSIASHAEAQKYTWIVFGFIVSIYNINKVGPKELKGDVSFKATPNNKGLFRKRMV